MEETQLPIYGDKGDKTAHHSSESLLSKSNDKLTSKPELQITIKSVDMPENMQRRAIALARHALSEFTVMRDIAGHVKRGMDGEFGQTWHCIVGKSFGSYVTHQNQSFVFFYAGELAFLLFKTA